MQEESIMQNRMKLHMLSDQEIERLLTESQVGRIASVDPEGYPYVVPVHFVYLNERIYFHGLPKGQKLDYISKNPKVGFEVDEMLSLISQGIEEPCDINTEYNSVIVRGNAEILTDIEYKKEVLLKIVEKYTPQLSGKDIHENMLKGTAVIEITIEELTGKYYK
jgi:hypothetical protein